MTLNPGVEFWTDKPPMEVGYYLLVDSYGDYTLRFLDEEDIQKWPGSVYVGESFKWRSISPVQFPPFPEPNEGGDQ